MLNEFDKYRLSIAISERENVQARLMQPKLQHGILGLILFIPEFYQSLRRYTLPGAALAERGFAVLAIEPQSRLLNAPVGFKIDRCAALGLKVLDKAIHHLRFLTDLPIAVMGHGLGAHIGFLMSAVDPRISVVCGLNPTLSMKRWLDSIRSNGAMDRCFYDRLRSSYPQPMIMDLMNSENPVQRIVTNRFVQKGLKQFPAEFGDAQFPSLLAFFRELFLSEDILTCGLSVQKPSHIWLTRFDPEGHPDEVNRWVSDLKRLGSPIRCDVLDSVGHGPATGVSEFLIRGADFFATQIETRHREEFTRLRTRLNRLRVH